MFIKKYLVCVDILTTNIVYSISMQYMSICVEFNFSFDS